MLPIRIWRCSCRVTRAARAFSRSEYSSAGDTGYKSIRGSAVFRRETRVNSGSREEEEKRRPRAGVACSVLLAARIADHLYVSRLEMPMLGIVLLHAGILRDILAVFLHIVHGCVRDGARNADFMSDVSSEIHGIVALQFPCAAVGRGQLEFIGAVALRETTGDGPHFVLRFRIARRVLRHCPGT